MSKFQIEDLRPHCFGFYVILDSEFNHVIEIWTFKRFEVPARRFINDLSKIEWRLFFWMFKLAFQSFCEVGLNSALKTEYEKFALRAWVSTLRKIVFEDFSLEKSLINHWKITCWVHKKVWTPQTGKFPHSDLELVVSGCAEATFCFSKKSYS